MSAPAQNAFSPSPVMIRARAFERPASLIFSPMFAISSKLSAFSACGRGW
jgi:hypothetical protein